MFMLPDKNLVTRSSKNRITLCQHRVMLSNLVVDQIAVFRCKRVTKNVAINGLVDFRGSAVRFLFDDVGVGEVC